MLEEGAWGWAVAVMVVLLFIGVSVGLGFGMYWLVALCVGVIMTTFGILLLRKTLKQPKKYLLLPVAILLTGIPVLVNGILMTAVPQQLEALKAAHGIQIGKVFTMIAGILIIVLPLADRMRKKKCCTAEVEATCVSRTRGYRGEYSCEYVYQYNGEEHSAMLPDRSVFPFTLTSKMQVGDVRTLYIDPVYFDEYYIPGDRMSLTWAVVLIGAMLFVGGLFLNITI